jgi:hypothetical protein
VTRTQALSRFLLANTTAFRVGARTVVVEREEDLLAFEEDARISERRQ